MLEGKLVNLRVVEKEELPLLLEWFNSPEFAGRYDSLAPQESMKQLEEQYNKLGSEKAWFIIEKTEAKSVS